jgi:hypothetical protein
VGDKLNPLKPCLLMTKRFCWSTHFRFVKVRLTPFLLDLSGHGVEQSDLLKLGMEIHSYNDHRSAPFSRTRWLVSSPPTLPRVREPTLSWNQ